MSVFSRFFVIFVFSSSVFAENLHQAAADYVCQTCVQKQRLRVAVFPFTDVDGKEDEKTAGNTTRMMASLLGCKQIKVIDKSKLNKVTAEQELGQTGLIDEETAPEVGKQIGAQALLFGHAAVGGKSLQIRIVDAVTGEILGASVQEPAGNNSRPQVTSLSQEEVKKDFSKNQMRRWIMRSARHRPALFIFATSTAEEWSAIRARYPRRAGRVASRIESLPVKKKGKIMAFREQVRRLRASDLEANQKIITLRRRVLQKTRKNARKKKRRRKRPRRRY